MCLQKLSLRTQFEWRYSDGNPKTQLAHQKNPPKKDLGRGLIRRHSRFCLLPCQGDVDSILRRDEVIEAHVVLGNGELHALDVTRKLVSTRLVVRRDRRSVVHSYIAAIIGGEDHGHR